MSLDLSIDKQATTTKYRGLSRRRPSQHTSCHCIKCLPSLQDVVMEHNCAEVMFKISKLSSLGSLP